MIATRRFVGMICGLASIIACNGAWGAALTVTSDTTETGAQTYTSGEIKSRATYVASGASASIVLPSGTEFHVGVYGGNNAGTMVLTNGASFYMPSGWLQVGSDDAAQSSRLIVSGASFTNTGDATYIGGSSSAGSHQFVANNGARVDVKGFEVYSPDARVDISGGAVVNSSSRVRLSSGFFWENANMTVTGTNTCLNLPATDYASGQAGALQIGVAACASMTVADGARVAVQGGVGISGSAANSSTGRLTMTSGAYLSCGLPAHGSENVVRIGYSSTMGGNVAFVDVRDPGTVLQAGGSVSISGPNSSSRSSLTISNGALVANPGVGGPWGVYVGDGDLLVTDGGTLEGYTFGTWGSSTFRVRSGGIFQFIHKNPVFYKWSGNPFEVENGGVSFVNINDAPVAMENNLVNLTFSGTNFFVLNNAGNTAISSYNFEEGLSPTNWASLRLIGSNSTWRCDATRIAPSGSLLASNTASTISGILTNEGALKLFNSQLTVAGDVALRSGSTLVVDLGATNATVCSRLTAQGGVSLGGTLQVFLRAAPTKDLHYRIIDKTSSGSVSGAFASGSTVSSDYSGKTYAMTVKTNAGDGNDVDLVWALSGGTVVIFR